MVLCLDYAEEMMHLVTTCDSLWINWPKNPEIPRLPLISAIPETMGTLQQGG